MTNTQPLSKRSKRLLEEASRHLLYAGKDIDRLSLDEYQRLTVTCGQDGYVVNIADWMLALRELRHAIAEHLRERGQP